MTPRLVTCEEGVRGVASIDRVKGSMDAVRDLGPMMRRLDFSQLSWR